MFYSMVTATSASARNGESVADAASSKPLRFTGLPTEIRLHIVHHCLPIIFQRLVLLPRTACSLLLTSRQTRDDTIQVLSRWQPVHYIPKPSPLFTPPRLIPAPDTIMISVFYKGGLECTGLVRSAQRSMLVYNDHSVRHWAYEARNLVKGVKRVIVDATPVPAWFREHHPEWVPSLVNDRRTTRFLIPYHTEGLSKLVVKLAKHYGHDTDIELDGLYGKSNKPSIQQVIQLCADKDVKLSFIGDFIPSISSTPSSIPFYSIEGALDHYSAPFTDRTDKPLLYPYIKLLLESTSWSPTTHNLFITLEPRDQHWLLDLWQRLLLFDLDSRLPSSGHPTAIDTEHMPAFRRKLVHSTVGDLGYIADSCGATNEWYIRLTRGKRTQDEVEVAMEEEHGENEVTDELVREAGVHWQGDGFGVPQ